MHASAAVSSPALTRRCLVIGAAASLTISAAAPRVAMAGEAARTFIETLAGEILAIVVGDAAPEIKRTRFHALLMTKADIPAIATFSLGKYARRISDDQKTAYYELVAAFISNVFVTYTADMGGEKVTVTGSTERSASETVVNSQVLFVNGRSLAVDWRVVEAGGVLKVRDVSVNGIWMAIQQRSQFTSVIKKGGGTIDALLDHLRENS